MKTYVKIKNNFEVIYILQTICELDENDLLETYKTYDENFNKILESSPYKKLYFKNDEFIIEDDFSSTIQAVSI